MTEAAPVFTHRIRLPCGGRSGADARVCDSCGATTPLYGGPCHAKVDRRYRVLEEDERCASYTTALDMRCVWFEGHDGDCAYGSAQADPPLERVE